MFKTMMKTTAVMGLALGATFVTPVERVEARNFTSFTSLASFSSDCGGLGQKTCRHINPKRHCKGDLVVKRQPGRNICVAPSSPGDKTGDCGGLNQKTCISLNPARHCDKGLTVLRQPGRNICIRKADLEPGSDQCGGENQLTCKSVLPAKWCDEGFTVQTQRGRNICVRDEMGVDKTKDCGGDGERSCIDIRPSRWCDAGLIYKPGGLPGRGRCEAADKDNMIQLTRAAVSRMKSLGSDNEFTKLRNCLIKPSRLNRLREEMKAQDSNGTNAIIRECNVDVSKLQDIAAYVLDQPEYSAARSASTGSASSSLSSDDSLKNKLRLTLELSGNASFFKSSVGGAIGYAIPLHEKPLGSRWYKGSDDYLAGLDLGVGADLLIGFGFPGVPSGNNAVESGLSGVVSGALGVKLAATLRGDTDNGGMMFAVFGGAGLGATVALFEYKNEFLRDR